MIIRRWWLKCTGQRVLSHVPAGHRLNALWRARQRATALNRDLLDQSLRYVRTLRSLGYDLEGRVALEVGPGWTPVMAYVLRLAGCRKVVLCDTTRHLTPNLLRATLRLMRGSAETLAVELGLMRADIEAILPHPASLDFPGLLAASGFDYRAPYALEQAEDLAESVDLVATHAVLEHVPGPQLLPLLRATRRVLRPEGLAIHFIDHVDHWHHFDPGISPINFLKFPPWWWTILNSPLAYQNRLRFTRHLAYIQEAGFEVIRLELHVDSQAFQDSRRLRLHQEFQTCTPLETAVTSSFVVARPEPLLAAREPPAASDGMDRPEEPSQPSLRPSHSA